MTELFRREVSDFRRHRLYGDVLIHTSKATSRFIIAICFMASSLLAWAATAKYSRIEQVQGVVISKKPSVKVIVQRPGQLKHLSVNEGSKVEKGDLLAVVLLDILISEGKYSGVMTIEELNVQRALLLQDAQVEERAYLQERKSIQAEITQTMTEARSLDTQIKIQTEAVVSSSRIFEMFNSLINDGMVSKNDHETKRIDMLLAQQRMSQLQQDAIKLQGQRAQLEAQLPKLVNEHARKNTDRATRISNLEQQRVKVQFDQEYSIEAPISGTVTSLQTAQGKSVDGKLPLLTIIPADAHLSVELYAPTRSVGFVQVGQPVSVMYDAFPYQRFGAFNAKVRNVSRSIFAPSEVDTPLKLEEPVFKVDADLDLQELVTATGSFPLRNGMTVKANIVLEQRTLLDFVLAPINSVVRRTF